MGAGHSTPLVHLVKRVYKCKLTLTTELSVCLPQLKNFFLEDIKTLLHTTILKKDRASFSQSLWRGNSRQPICQVSSLPTNRGSWSHCIYTGHCFVTLLPSVSTESAHTPLLSPLPPHSPAHWSPPPHRHKLRLSAVHSRPIPWFKVY